MVNRGATREYQRSRIQEEVDRLMKKRASVKGPIAVFSMKILAMMAFHLNQDS